MSSHLDRATELGWEVFEEKEEPAECPEALLFIFSLFLELHAQRTGNGFGPNPISQETIHYYQLNTGIRFNIFELRCISVLDRAYRSEYAKAEEKKQATKNPKKK